MEEVELNNTQLSNQAPEWTEANSLNAVTDYTFGEKSWITKFTHIIQ